FSMTHHQQARGLAQLADAKLRSKRIEDGAITLEMIQKAVAETPAKFYAELIDDIAKAGEQFQGFCNALSERSGFDPPSSEVLGALESSLDVVKDLARDKPPKVQQPAVAPAAGSGPSPPASEPPAPAGVINNRDDALDRLRKVADYFRE